MLQCGQRLQQSAEYLGTMPQADPAHARSHRWRHGIAAAECLDERSAVELAKRKRSECSAVPTARQRHRIPISQRGDQRQCVIRRSTVDAVSTTTRSWRCARRDDRTVHRARAMMQARSWRDRPDQLPVDQRATPRRRPRSSRPASPCTVTGRDSASGTDCEPVERKSDVRVADADAAT
jgi:hypothetical protein